MDLLFDIDNQLDIDIHIHNHCRHFCSRGSFYYPDLPLNVGRNDDDDSDDSDPPYVVDHENRLL